MRYDVISRDLKSQIEALKSSKDPSQEKQPTYEVYTRTEAAKFAHLSKVTGDEVTGIAQCDCLFLVAE